MTLKLAINGFGRIGRNVLRALYESGQTDLEIVAINDLAPTDNLAHLLKYDSVHGRFPGKITHTKDSLNIGRGDIQVTAIRNLNEQNWADNDVDIVYRLQWVLHHKCAGTPRESSQRLLRN